MSTHQLLQRFLQMSYDFTGARGTAAVSKETLNAYASAITRKIPSVAYTGRMFRGITLPADDVVKFTTKQALESHISKQGVARGGAGIASWSRTIEGCLEYMNEYGAIGVESLGYDDTYYAKKTVNAKSINVVVIYEQHATGLDYKKLREHLQQSEEFKGLADHYGQMLATTGGVEEILAGHSNKLRLGLLTIEGLGDKLKNPRDDWGDIKTHYAERTSFRPDDYTLFHKALVEFMSGNKIRGLKGKTKKPHDKSQYNADRVDSMSTARRWQAGKEYNEDEFGTPYPRFSDDS